MSVILGIDAGGTKTRASIMQGERTLAYAEGDSVKRLRVGAEVADANLRALLKEVYTQAGVTGIRAASVGLASSTLPGIKEWMYGVLKDCGVERAGGGGDGGTGPRT